MTCNINDTSKSQSAKPDKAPGTDAPDGSAVLLKAAGQIKITIGWIFGAIFGAVAIATCFWEAEMAGWLAVLFFLFAVIIIWKGYAEGAKDKAAAVAAINAKNAAERVTRMEQMMVNMVSGTGNSSQPSQQTQAKCLKCGATLPFQAKFCPECGESTKTTCAKCGAEIASGMKFCPECGAKLDVQSNTQA
jgi:ribosomal protein L40E